MGVRLGNGNWGVKTSKLLAYNDASGMFFNKEFDFTRATTATRVNKSGLIEVVDTNIPRIDFTDDTKGHLLLEPTSFNYDVNSADLSTGWTASTGATASVETGTTPFGISGNIKRLSGATNSPPSWVDNVNALKKQYTVLASDPASTFTFSVYVKSAGSTTVNIQLRNNTAGPSATTGAITLSSDWQRVSVTLAVTTTTTAIGVVIGGTDGDILLSGAQLESKTFATSLIPTSGTTVTRNADVCNGSGAAQDFNSTEGVLYAEIAALADDTISRAVSISNSTIQNTAEIFYNSGSNQVSFRIRASNANVTVQNRTVSDRTQFVKVALKYKDGDIEGFINGVKEVDRTDSFTFSASLSELAFDRGGDQSHFEGKIREVRTYRTALTDAELIALTT